MCRARLDDIFIYSVLLLRTNLTDTPNKPMTTRKTTLYKGKLK